MHRYSDTCFITSPEAENHYRSKDCFKDEKCPLFLLFRVSKFFPIVVVDNRMASIRDLPESSAYQKQGRAQNKKATREPVLIEQLCVGCIVWMPEQKEGAISARCIMPQCPCNNSELDENGSEHHLVVLNIFKTDNGEVRCHVGKVTSKASKAKNFSARIKIYQEPSASSTEQRDLYNGLHLETGELRKQSHVSLGHVYEVSPSLFSTKIGVPAYDRRLSEQSYYYLMQLMGLKAATYEHTNYVGRYGATMRYMNAETPSNFYNSETLEARFMQVDVPNVSSSIGPAQRMAAFTRPNPLNPQYRPSSPPQGSPTSQASNSTGSLRSPILEQHSPGHGSMRSEMTWRSRAASITTVHSASLASPGHDMRLTSFDAEDAAHQQETFNQRAMEEEQLRRIEEAAMEEERRRRNEEAQEIERRRRNEEAQEIERRRRNEEAQEIEHRRRNEEAQEIERRRLIEEAAAEKERQRLIEEAKRERIRRNVEALERECLRRNEEALEIERLRLHEEAVERERQSRSRAALEEEHLIRKKAALERERQRRSRDSLDTEHLVRTEAALARQHYLKKIATLENQHPPEKEAAPLGREYLRRSGATSEIEYPPQKEAPLGREYLRREATSEREHSRRTESPRHSEHGRTQTRDVGSGGSGSGSSSSWSHYTRHTKYTRISEYTHTRITEYTRYTSEVVMHGVENAPWRAMSVGSVVVVGCYSYYSGSYEVGLETAKGLAGGLKTVAGVAGRVFIKAGKALSRLRQ
ncbi:hypothetical protein OCU04_008165 [Sclerotinia nivalis]|uniref:Uncharacterized protein n=1 Tax=Sclerotinia nivalis TaxID=352851 RepID=A0A9X0AHM4_9HELO|nr:hypothetical protein OCU04_008165 [Sclerotinia nivalis]